MAEEEGGHGEEPDGTKTTPEHTAAIYAAMMEELGIARKDTLPLEDKKGTGGHVDLNALDRDKKANDPRTAEFQIAQKNASAHAAWKNAVFDDVDEADLELDNMNSGQSHRQRMKAELEASSISRGGYATRGGRGGQPAIRGGSHSLSRNKPGGFSSRGGTKLDQVDMNKVLARLGGNLGPQGRATRGGHGTSRDGLGKPFKHAGIVTAPKSNLSFGDSRSVNALPFGRDVSDRSAPVLERGSREPQVTPKVVKPNNYNQGFKLASPVDFLAQGWAGKSGNDAPSKHPNEVAPDGSLDQALKPATVVDNTLGNETRAPATITTPSSMSNDFQRLSKRSTIRSLVDSSDDIVFSTPVQIANEIGGKFLMIGPGTVCIKTVNQSSKIAKVIQVENGGETRLEEPLLENFDFKVDLCTLSFYSGFEANRTKWILTASEEGIATSLAEALKRLKPSSMNRDSVDTPSESHAYKVEERDNLISFSDEDCAAPPAVSQFNEDLFSLMGAEFIVDAVNAINLNIGQNHTLEVASGVPGKREAEFTKTLQTTPRGLAISRFANQIEVGDFLNRSAIFQKLPDITAACIKAQVSKGVFEKAQKDACNKEVFEPVKRQPRTQYSVETLMGLGNHPRSANNASRLDPWVEYDPKGQPQALSSFPGQLQIASESPNLTAPETAIQNTFRTTRLGVPVVSSRDTPRKLSELAASDYATAETAVIAQEPTKVKEQESSASSNKPQPRALRPTQGLSASRYASPTANSLSRDHLDSKKPGSSSEKSTQELSSPNDRADYALKEFKSFLNSQQNHPLRPKCSQGPPISGHAGTSHVKPMLEPSASSHFKTASSEPLKGPLTQNLDEPLVRKPYQGLASSKYASPIVAKLCATKINPSAPVQDGIKIPPLNFKSGIMEAIVPDPKDDKLIMAQANAASPSMFSMILNAKEDIQDCNDPDQNLLTGIVGNVAPSFPKSGGWINLRRRDSFNSHASKDSNETIKPLMPKPTMQIVQDYAVPIESSRATSSHQSILCMDSSFSGGSFATAIEQTSTAVGGMSQALVDRGQPCGIQTGISDLLFSDDVGAPEAHRKEIDPKSPYSSDMTELMGDILPAASQTDVSDVKLVSSFKPFSFPTMQPSKLTAKANGGLLSSRYATSSENIVPAATKPKRQQSSTAVSNEVKKGPTAENLTSNPLSHRIQSITSSQDLKPTASEFTPSISRSITTQTRNGPLPAIGTFSHPMQPVIATIFVPDPHNPGMLVEMSGLLKHEAPIVGYVAATGSILDENLISGSGLENIVPSQRTPLTPIIQSKNTKDTQKELQERLTKSLTERRLS